MRIHGFDLEPISYSKDILPPEWSWASNVNHWTGFHLWYVVANGVKIKANGRVYNLTQGDTFIFDLAENHHCTQDPGRPATLYTLYFHCREKEKFQKMLAEGKIPRQNHPELYNSNVSLMEQAQREGGCLEDIMVWFAPIFRQLLEPVHHTDGWNRVVHIQQMMDTAPQNKYPLKELAKQAGYSENQLIRLFRHNTGCTPYAYLLNARIKRAKNLLLFSDYTVTEIAQMLGYNDLNHFSRQFHDKTGCYPSMYARMQNFDNCEETQT